ncbi:MAG: GNAT family N-acetyltransferase [Solirubrobacteraceae bacterium]|jgi:GNAT superfamily N-acetyltransferase
MSAIAREDQADAPVVRAAGPEDVPLLLELFGELAAYERLEHELRATEEGLEQALFSDRPAAEALIARRGSETAGYALFFPTFSSFLSIQGVWLEDLFVRPAHRGGGVGRALLAAVAARARERGAGRLEWAALDWNELALGFYRRLGAQTMDEWITHRMVGEELERLAGEAAADPPGER